VLTCAGNHEVGSSEQWLSYNARWRMPAAQSGSSDNTYWAIEVGPIFVLALNSYAPTEPGSLQFEWARAALARVDRARTPWLVVMMHAPFYCSNSGHVEETRLMRRDMERLLYDAGADVVLNGHVHAYERSFPTFDMAADECGPVYLTLGDGGNREGAYMPWLEPQPDWSAYRESSFGVGTLEVVNASHARYEWHRHSCQGSDDPHNINFNQTCESISAYARENGDLLGVDATVFEKPAACANRWRSGAAPAPAAAAQRVLTVAIDKVGLALLGLALLLSVLANVALGLVALRARRQRLGVSPGAKPKLSAETSESAVYADEQPAETRHQSIEVEKVTLRSR
jgi:hypothetical protein